METLTFEIPDDLSDYFLDFSSKEEYLTKRSEWRELYKWLSRAIRHNKKSNKIELKTRAKIMNRMNKKGWNGWYCYPSSNRDEFESGLAEFNSRVQVALSGFPEEVSLYGLDATELLGIRKEMKVESSKQREASLLLVAA
jgi:hypothetical protein